MTPAFTQLVQEVYKEPRALDERTKELVLGIALASAGGNDAAVQAHLQRAVDAGASLDEVSECVDLVLLIAGGARFLAARGLLEHLAVNPVGPASGQTPSDHGH